MSAVMRADVEANQVPRWLPAYVGVGSNLAEPESQVRKALAALAGIPDTRVEATSPLYRTAPFGPVEQPPFVNAVAGLVTRLSPEQLLEHLRALEIELGRQPPRERWGPRVIDLDLLVVGRETRSGDTLTLPHPGIAQRDFVLFPLADVAPQLEIPGVGVVATLRAAVTDRGIGTL